jgi:hypothetical protein
LVNLAAQTFGDEDDIYAFAEVGLEGEGLSDEAAGVAKALHSDELAR